MQAASKRGGCKPEFPGASQYMDRHGKPRWRLRRAGSSVNLGSEYGSDDFIRRYNAAMGLQDQPSTRAIRAVPGSLGYAVESWLGSPQFLRLADSTRYT